MSPLIYIFSLKYLKYNFRIKSKNPIREFQFFLKWYFSSKRLKSIERLKQFQNIHFGKRCFIIGNGPSLNKMDLKLLRNEYTFGLNRIYLMFPKIGFQTSYLLSINKILIEQFKDEISKLDMPKFINCRTFDEFPLNSNTIFINTIGGRPQFSHDPAEIVWESGTVTYAAIQIAYYMGFSKIILIGVDHNFKSSGPPNTTVLSVEDDPNHFDPSYFGKGIKWQLPDLYSSELGYNLANDICKTEGRTILDATIDGKLNIFPKTDYYNLF